MSAALEHAFRPIRVGTLALDHRLVVPPHGGGNGNLMGSEADFEQHCALWLAKARGGMQWLGGGPNFVANPLPVGFEPTGIGSHGPGFFRDPRYPARLGEFARRIHDAGAFVTVQMVQQGGMPSAPSATFSGYADHRIAHALDLDEVQWLIREYAESAAIAIDAGVDAIEIHANHDDVVQWFLSPATNLRTDTYGGSFDNRRRFLREIAESIRAAAPRPFTFGLRLNLDEMIDGGYGIDECQRLVAAFTADGTVDYFSFDVGGNWDAPSYIPIPWYGDAPWAELCGQAKQATHLPVVYTGRVTSVELAEQVLAAGHADLVGMARASMADPDLVLKARGVDATPLRPCIGLNECIHRKLIDGLVYACGVNPTFARELELTGRPARTSRPTSVLVVGGGPAGTELAALCAEQGHTVELWERGDALGGALAVAALARGNATYRRWIDWQTERLARAGVDVQLRRTATADDLVAHRAAVVALATGAVPRRPPIPGADGAHAHAAAAVLRGEATLGRRLAVIVEDDGPAPLAVADHLAGLGHEVTFVYQSTGPAPLVGKYSNGGMLARLVDGGVTWVPMARAVAIADDGCVELASSYGTRRWTIGPFDDVVLATGAVPDDALYRALKARRDGVQLLGDAFAPRRMVFATRQAFALAQTLL